MTALNLRIAVLVRAKIPEGLAAPYLEAFQCPLHLLRATNIGRKTHCRLGHSTYLQPASNTRFRVSFTLKKIPWSALCSNKKEKETRIAMDLNIYQHLHHWRDKVQSNHVQNTYTIDAEIYVAWMRGWCPKLPCNIRFKQQFSCWIEELLPSRQS